MKRRKILLFLIDAVCFAGVCAVMSFIFFGAYLLADEVKMINLLVNSGLVFLCITISRLIFAAYSRIWRYAGYTDYIRLVFSDFVAGLFFATITKFFVPDEYSLRFLQILAIVAVNSLAQLVMRFFYQFLRDKRKSSLSDHHNKINIAIIGAGTVGVSLAKDIIANPYSRFRPYCFVDQDNNKVGGSILNIPVIKESKDIVEQIKKMPVQEIVLALPNLSSEQKNAVYELYSKTNLKVKIYDYPLELDGTATDKRTLRDINIEDLLFRGSRDFESSEASAYYAGKTIMITGGGGSIGSELCRQIAKARPKRLLIVDIYENNAYDIQQELLRKYGDKLNLSVRIASVRDAEKLDEIFTKYKPQIVFHAAAHKHVPLMEDSASEAVKNNVFGTYNVANIAEKHGVEKFILISTDKAVNPTNVMGASKRMCEMVVQSKKDSDTCFAAVRFGNVLGSNGSVIPLFKKQLENGGPLTITDKRIIRYFMTIPEAAQLVLHAGAMAQKSEIYVLDMGKPIKIIDLAENMIRLTGFTPYVDIDIVEVGLRPGEKLYEELLIKTEELDKTENSLIFIERDKGITREELEEKLAVLDSAVKVGGNANIRKAFMDVVPTFHSAEEVNAEAINSEEMQLAETV